MQPGPQLAFFARGYGEHIAVEERGIRGIFYPHQFGSAGSPEKERAVPENPAEQRTLEVHVRSGNPLRHHHDLAGQQALGMPVPPALSAFWHVVGEIELVPDYSVHQALPDGVPGVLWGMDPLEVHGRVCIDIGLAEWRDQQEGAHPEAALLDLWVSRDGALKMGASGSMNTLSLPFAGADPVVHDGLGLRFTDYLRRAFGNKGFLDDCRTMYGTDEEKSAAAQWLASVEFEPIGF